MAQNREDNPVGRSFGTGYALVGASFLLVFSILFFMGMGYLADRWLGSRPVLMLVGIVVGLATGFYAFISRVMAVSAPRGTPKDGSG